MLENVNFNAQKGKAAEFDTSQLSRLQPVKTESFQCIICKDQPSFTSRKGLTLHIELTHPQSGVSSTDVIKKSLGLSFAEIIENAQKMSAKRPMSSPTISPVVKKIRVQSGD